MAEISFQRKPYAWTRTSTTQLTDDNAPRQRQHEPRIDYAMPARLTELVTGPDGTQLHFSPETDRIKDYTPFLGKKFFLFICDDADE